MLRKMSQWVADGRRTSRLQILFLHIGVEKTGTKTLQLTLAMNRRRLQASGFIYPSAPDQFNHFDLVLYAADPMAVDDLRQAAGLVDSRAYDVFLERYPRQIAQELARSGCHTAIFSAEHCSSRLVGEPPENTRKLPADVAIFA